MEDYSEGRAEESHEEEKVESATDIAVVVEEDFSSSVLGSAGEEKLVSEPPSVEVSEVTLESSRDVEPGDSSVAELDAAVSAMLTEQATQDVEPESEPGTGTGDSGVAELEAAVSQIFAEQVEVTKDIEPGDAADSPISTEQVTLESSEVVVTDVESKETDEGTTPPPPPPPALDTTNESSVVASDSNAAENSSGFPEPNVEESLQAEDVLVVETTVAGDAEVVDKADIDENTGNQSPADSTTDKLKVVKQDVVLAAFSAKNNGGQDICGVGPKMKFVAMFVSSVGLAS
ncbi:hypothetical protein V6N11_078162 [Hibiscus sabdariffa]|uniref:Uncharacterized protein n=1 Tax=Hibiscus sabdariffa TaxID=183260 RepID=A0ABR2TFG6_9ROSI